jgi:hypothetical protein
MGPSILFMNFENSKHLGNYEVSNIENIFS